MKGTEKINDINIKYIIIPKGTILFSYGKKSTKHKPSVNTMYTKYEKFFGLEQDNANRNTKIKFTDDWQLFFFPFPLLGYGVKGLGLKYMYIGTYVTTTDLKLLYLLGPDNFYRTQAKSKTSSGKTNPLFKLQNVTYTCPVKTYDLCLEPDIKLKHNYSGFITIAYGESIYNTNSGFKTIMTEHIKKFDNNTKMWILNHLAFDNDTETSNKYDSIGKVGFPEIVISPLKLEYMEKFSVPNSKNISTSITYEDFDIRPNDTMFKYYNIALLNSINEPVFFPKDKTMIDKKMFDYVKTMLNKYVFIHDKRTGFLLYKSVIKPSSLKYGLVSSDYKSIAITNSNYNKNLLVDYLDKNNVVFLKDMFSEIFGDAKYYERYMISIKSMKGTQFGGSDSSDHHKYIKYKTKYLKSKIH